MFSFLVYLKQRFNILLFALLSVYLLGFSKSVFHFGTYDAWSVFFLFFFLFIMRLYEDLRNSWNHRNIPNRIYTDDSAAEELFYMLITLCILYLSFLSVADLKAAVSTLCFIAFNHFTYLAFFNRKKFRFYLPLLKFPFIIIILRGGFTWNAVAVFFLFLCFEMADDDSFPGRVRLKYLAAIASILFLAIETPPLALLYSLPFQILALYSLRKTERYNPYLFLCFMLLGHVCMLLFKV
jgi:hypothetical protein